MAAPHHVNPGALPSADDDLREELEQAVAWTVRYLEHIAEHPVLARSAPGDVRRALPSAPPQRGEPFSDILADIDRVLLPAMTHWNAPGFLAYFGSSSQSAGIAGELLAAAFNVNAMLWRTAPAATELEQVVTDWLRQLVGLPEPMFGVINDTASSSTLYALAAARQAVSPASGEGGISGMPRMRCYASEEAHSSVAKACMVLGLGRAGLRSIPTDDAFRMRPDLLDAAISDDRSRGVLPAAVVATAGTTSTTSVDPVDDIAAVCERHGVWLHVDAAYGGAAAASPQHRWVLDGAGRADSIVINPHKWLFTPLDCSVLWTRRPDMLRAAFSLTPDYLRSPEETNPDAPNLMDYGTSLGRRFRALKLWMVLRRFGSDGIASRIDAHCAFAADIAQRLRQSGLFEVMAPVPLSVVCFRAVADGLDDGALEQLNLALLHSLNSGGRFFLSHTRLCGRFALRVAFGNVRTTNAHVDALWEELCATRQRALDDRGGAQ